MTSSEQGVGVEQSFKDATKCIEDAEVVMSRTKASVEKTRASKDGRNKVVSKASEIVNALLEPASQVANLLNQLGTFFPPCGAAASVLQGIVDLESDRRDSDARIGMVFMDMSTTLVVLGTLKPGFEEAQELAIPLTDLVKRICDTMKSFGQFSEAFYDAKAFKSKLKHLLHAKTNKEQLAEFHNQFAAYKQDLAVLLSQQTVLVSSMNATSLSRIEVKINRVYGFFASLSDEKEEQSIDFIDSCGGEDRVRNDDSLLDKLAAKVGESLTPNIRRAVKESAEEVFKQSSASFNLKFEFAIEQRIDISTEMIIKELNSGPYELITDPDMKEIWKATAAKESSVKRRQFIDAMVYYFNREWKKYKVERKTDREDFWTKSIISKVHYHPAIGDAIDDDASGYISVEELNEFLRRKPADWTVPQWVAYWAYGWDADNIYYQEKLEKCYKQLESLRDKPGPNTERIKRYLEETQKPIQIIARSVYTMSDLDSTAETKMNNLRLEWRLQMESTIKDHLKAINYKIEYSRMSAICGSDRIEATFLPLVSLVLARHVHMLSQSTVSEEDVEEAIYIFATLVEVVHDRIDDLRVIWRRQRIDVDVQIRYYANGLFQDYYKQNRADFDTDVEDEDMSEWNSEDEWGSEDNGPGHERPVSPDGDPSSTSQARGARDIPDDTDEAALGDRRDIAEQSERYKGGTTTHRRLKLPDASDEEAEGKEGGGDTDSAPPDSADEADQDAEEAQDESEGNQDEDEGDDADEGPGNKQAESDDDY